MIVRQRWRTIPEFPNYDVGDQGQIYNTRQDRLMSTSQNNYGHEKITLTAFDGSRHTRSVAQLVADAFVVPPNMHCDCVVVLDGNFSNVAAENLVWRPRWFAWKYTRQLKTDQPRHYRNLRVRNVVTDYEYNSIIDAGISEGLLFEEIWRSTYRGTPVYPTDSIFEVVDRV